MGNSQCKRNEDYRSDNHFYQFDEPISQRFHFFSQFRIKFSKKNTCNNGDDHLEIKLIVYFFLLSKNSRFVFFKGEN